MAVVPVTGTIPDSTLSPFQVRQKFNSQSLAGLGDDFCVDYADDGSCNYSIPYDPNQTTLNIPTEFATQNFPDPGLFSGAGSSYSSGPPTVLNTYVDSAGTIWVSLSNGMEYGVSQTGSVSKGSGSSPASGNRSVTSAQANAWPSMVAALINAGVRVGTVASLPPGASLTPNGTIVGRGQSLVAPGTITSSSITSTLSSLAANPMFLIGGFGILALALFAGGRR